MGAITVDRITKFKQEIPTCDLSSTTRLRWSLKFLFNFTFGIDQNPDLIQEFTESNQDSSHSKSLQEKVFEEFILKNNTIYDDTLPLPEVNQDEFSFKEFKAWRTKINMPIVFRGFIKDSIACQKWSMDWLNDNFGDKTVQCVPPDIASLYGEKVKLEEISIKDFCTLPEYRDYYINNHHSIFENQDFYNCCNGKQIEDLRGRRHLIDQWFISRSTKTGSSLHCANGDNMFLNIKGRKEWHFIHPSYTPLLSPLLSKYGIYAVAGIEKTLLSNWDSIRDKYPVCRYIPTYKVVLEEGDVLFNPPWWWHSVRNLDEFTLSCATRYLALKTAKNIKAFHYAQIVEAFKHPIKSIYPQTIVMLLNRRGNKKLLNSIFSKS